MCGEVSEFVVRGKALGSEENQQKERETSRIWSPCLSIHACDNPLLDAESGMKQKPCFFKKKMVFEKFHFLESELLIWSQLCCVYEEKKAVLSYSLVSLLVCTQLEQRDTEPDMEMRWKIDSTGCEMLVNSQLMFTAAHSSASHGMVQCMVVSEEAFEEHGTCLMPLHCLTDVKWRGISRMYI